MPFMGDIGIAAGDVLMQFTEASMVALSHENPASQLWMPLLEDARRAALEKTEREKNIARIFDGIVDVSKMQFLKEGLEYPVSKDALVENRRTNVYNARGPINDLSEELMNAYRDAGYLEKCPNNGSRNIRGMTEWNVWLSGEDLGRYGQMYLDRAPGFGMMRQALISASVEVEMDIEKSLSPDGKINYSDRPKFDLTEDDVDREIAGAVAKAREAFINETTDLLMSRDTSTCQVTGQHLRIGGTLFAPVLTRFTEDYKDEIAPLVETPKPALHFEIPLPTGELVMGDWIRMEGFKEGLMSLVGGDDSYEINNSVGLDERMQDYFVKAGLVIVQVGNSSPHAYTDTSGVWRMGYVDDDNERFYDENGERTEVELPSEGWSTCTDLWANVFADRSVIVDILMASGVYESRLVADAALLEHVDDAYGTTINKLDVDRLHIYAPTGFGCLTGSFIKDFRAQELEYSDWREDKYVLSAQPLTVDPEFILETGWEAPAQVVADTPGPC